jgi:hypothetical protein
MHRQAFQDLDWMRRQYTMIHRRYELQLLRQGLRPQVSDRSDASIAVPLSLADNFWAVCQAPALPYFT